MKISLEEIFWSVKRNVESQFVQFHCSNCEKWETHSTIKMHENGWINYITSDDKCTSSVIKSLDNWQTSTIHPHSKNLFKSTEKSKRLNNYIKRNCKEKLKLKILKEGGEIHQKFIKQNKRNDSHLLNHNFSKTNMGLEKINYLHTIQEKG
jgi:hypothetical protein